LPRRDALISVAIRESAYRERPDQRLTGRDSSGRAPQPTVKCWDSHGRIWDSHWAEIRCSPMVLPVACGSSESGASYRILWRGRIDKCVWGYRFRAIGSYPQVCAHEAPAAPGSGWTFLDILENKKPAARGFSGHYWTPLDANENPIGGPGGIRIRAEFCRGLKTILRGISH